MKKIFGLLVAVTMLFATAGNAWAEAANSNPLSDPRVRQAIAYAIDMDTIVDTLLEGKAISAVGLLPNGPLKPEGLNEYSYNPEKARELLAEAGWDSNQELDLVYYYSDQLTVDMMAAFQAYLGDVGIKMSYRQLEGDVASQLNTVPSDPVSGPSAVKWNLGYGARAALALQEYYNGFETGRSAHTPGSSELDRLIANINATSDPTKLKTAYGAIQEYQNEVLNTIPLYYQQLFIYESTRLDRNGGSYGNEQYNYDWGIVDWTIEPDADGKKVMYTNTAPAQFFEQPWLNLGIWIHSKVVFDRLLVADGSLTSFSPQLAESYNVSEDGMTVSFTLQDGLTWHDGSPLTIDDVAWSLKTAAMIPTVNPVVSNTIQSIAGMEEYVAGSATDVSGIALDGNTITLSFANLDPNVLLTFSQFSPLPAAYFPDIDPLLIQQSSFWQKPIGSGPFMISEVKMNDFTTLVPFQDYHGGVAKIDEIVAFPSGDGDGNLLKNAGAGKADYGFTKNTADVAALEAMDFMRVTPADTPYTRMLWVNQYPMQ